MPRSPNTRVRGCRVVRSGSNVGNLGGEDEGHPPTLASLLARRGTRCACGERAIRELPRLRLWLEGAGGRLACGGPAADPPSLVAPIDPLHILDEVLKAFNETALPERHRKVPV